MTIVGACILYAVGSKIAWVPERVRTFHFSFNDMIVGILLFFGLSAGYLYYVT